MNAAVALWILATSLTVGGSLSESDILGQADARIEKYRTGDVILRLVDPSGRPIRSKRRVRIEQTRHKFLFGSNIFKLGKCRTPAENAAYEQRFAELLNYATLPFYWWMYEPKPGEPSYAATEQILAWCRAHNVTPKGHPLAWNWVDPAWLPSDPEGAMRLQIDRVEQCVKKFRDELTIFDVVNEATHVDRPQSKAQAPMLTAAILRMGVPAYIRAAFESARQANPRATLVINDYDPGPAYVENVLSKLVDVAGQPLYDIIGIQCHQHAGVWPASKIWDICDRFAAFGKPLHFTEATILSGRQGFDLRRKEPGFQWESTPEGEQRQAKDVERFYTVLFSHPAVEAITWWDFSDQGAWLGAPAGLVRADMTPKPAFEVLKQLIKGKWWTQIEVRVGRQGEVRFHGFFGDYRATLEDNGRTLTGTFFFDKSTHQPIEVHLK